MTCLCLSCRRITSAPGALYCSSCRRSFGAKRCGSQHASSMSARFCAVCGSDQLSEPTAYVPLGWLGTVGAILLVGTLWRLGWQHRWQALAASARLGLSALSFLFSSSPRGLVQGALHLAVWLAAIYVLSCLLPGGLGKPARAALVRLPKAIASLIGRLIAPVIWMLIKLPEQRDPKQRNKK